MSTIIMTNADFVNKVKDVANNYNTVYMNGTFGQPVTENLIEMKSQQLPKWYTKDRQAYFRTLIGKNYFGFDCVGLVKGILWGWCGDSNKSHGGASYQSNGVPDVTESGMLNLCTNVTTDFTNIPIGAFLWVDGHCGVYVGNKQAVECTPKWQNKVQFSNVANLGNTGGNSRKWTKWGKLPWINYIASDTYYNGVDYAPVFDADYYLNYYPDLKKAFGNDKIAAFNHFTTYGMNEQRRANEPFYEVYYRENYADLRAAFRNNYPDYYRHYCVYGKNENRVADRLLSQPTDTLDGSLKPVRPMEKYPEDLLPTKTTKQGDKGEEVKKVQQFLNWYGEYQLAIDGDFGNKTCAAVKKFQKSEKLKVDGVFGPECIKRAKIVEIPRRYDPCK